MVSHTKKWFLCIFICAVFLVFLLYSISEVISQQIKLLAVPATINSYSDSYRQDLHDMWFANSTTPRDGDRHEHIENLLKDTSAYIIPKEKVNFYRSRLKASPRRRSRNKILGEVPDEAHVLAMKAIQALERSGKIEKFGEMSGNKQDDVYIKALEFVGYTKRLPTIINIGAKKAGTTALGLFFRSHPQVASSLGNEVHYFDWNYEKGIEYYRSRMQYSTDSQEVFEKTPRYFITEEAPRRIKEDISPDVKIILIVRDPVERAISDYHHETELIARRTKPDGTQTKTGKGPHIEDTFEETVLRENGEVDEDCELIHIGKYAMHLRRWLEYFPMNQIIVVDGIEITNDPLKQMKILEDFFGLEPYFTENHFVYMEDLHVYCLALPVQQCRFSTGHRIPKPVLSDELRKTLYDFYRPYNRELVELLNQTFTWVDL